VQPQAAPDASTRAAISDVAKPLAERLAGIPRALRMRSRCLCKTCALGQRGLTRAAHKPAKQYKIQPTASSQSWLYICARFDLIARGRMLAGAFHRTSSDLTLGGAAAA